MFVSFFQPVAHLAFDDSRVDSVAAWFEDFGGDFRQQVCVPASQSRRAARSFGQAATQDLQRVHERQVTRCDVSG